MNPRDIVRWGTLAVVTLTAAMFIVWYGRDTRADILGQKEQQAQSETMIFNEEGTPIGTITPQPTDTGTPDPCASPTAEATLTPTSSGSPGVTVTPGPSVTPCPSATVIGTVTPTPTGSPGVTVTPTPSTTVGTATPTTTITPTVTGTAGTNTPTPTSTAQTCEDDPAPRDIPDKLYTLSQAPADQALASLPAAVEGIPDQIASSGAWSRLQINTTLFNSRVYGSEGEMWQAYNHLIYPALGALGTTFRNRSSTVLNSHLESAGNASTNIFWTEFNHQLSFRGPTSSYSLFTSKDKNLKSALSFRFTPPILGESGEAKFKFGAEHEVFANRGGYGLKILASFYAECDKFYQDNSAETRWRTEFRAPYAVLTLPAWHIKLGKVVKVTIQNGIEIAPWANNKKDELRWIFGIK